MTRTLEFLDEALEDAEEAARWYAERSEVAAVAFAEELDAAIAHIEPGKKTLRRRGTRNVPSGR